jgi:hypothetical protein
METSKWIQEIDPEVVKLVVWKDAKVEVNIGDLRCKLFRSCPSYAVALTAIHAAAAGIRPTEALRYCVSCKTDAHAVFRRFVKCTEVREVKSPLSTDGEKEIEVRENEYLFVVVDRDGKELKLIFEDLNEAFEKLNEFFLEHHHMAIDDDYFYEFEKLVYEHASRCA